MANTKEQPGAAWLFLLSTPARPVSASVSEAAVNPDSTVFYVFVGAYIDALLREMFSFVAQ
jgi:hypothetical protein